MDEQTRDLFTKHGSSITALTIQITLLTVAVEALIATHSNPAAVRNVFDQMWGQFQVGPAYNEASPEDRAFARAAIDKLFAMQAR
jgi:hypothetical protein